MKKLLSALTVIGFVTTGMAHAAPALNTNMGKVSYSVGYDIGKGFKAQKSALFDIQADTFEAGFQAGLSGSTPAMTEANMQSTLVNFQKEMQQQAVQNQQAAATTNLKLSHDYLTKIAAQTGVTQLQPGLYYKVLTAGTGKIPGATDVVTVNYTGTLPDGKVFDSSYQRGTPATFQINQVIPGWSKVLQKMPVGSTWMVYMDPSLAYGISAPPQIGPNQALTFKIELISVGQPAANSNS